MNINSLKTGDIVYNKATDELFKVNKIGDKIIGITKEVDINNPENWEIVTDHILGRAAPIHYLDFNYRERFCLVKIKNGLFKGKIGCLCITFKDESIVDLGASETSNYNLHYIKNSDINFNLEEHLKTNKLIEEANELKRNKS